MKKVIFTFLSFCLLYAHSNAQSCNNSGPSVCTISGTLTEPGLSPKSGGLSPFIVGVDSNRVIQFENFDSIPNPAYHGQTGVADSFFLNALHVDSITGLPDGLCWATSNANDSFVNQEAGCIKISGTPTGPAGQYKLGIYVTVYPEVGFYYPVHREGGAVGLYYYIRVNDASDTVARAIDTAGQSAHITMFNQYYPVGIKEAGTSINKLNIAPNPFNSKTVVSFYSEKDVLMTERISNIIGSEVSKKQFDAKSGENSTVVDRSNLPAGVYFYSLSDGKTVTTKRMVITD